MVWQIWTAKQIESRSSDGLFSRSYISLYIENHIRNHPEQFFPMSEHWVGASWKVFVYTDGDIWSMHINNLQVRANKN
jgi:hypothetical protein